MGLIKQSGIGFLKLIAISTVTSRIFLSLISAVCKSLPDARWKSYIKSAINQVKWKPVSFRPRKVQVGQVKNIFITPHMNEFDFDGMIWNVLPYEPELYSFLDKSLVQFTTIIDIGANVGLFSVYAAKTNAGISVYSFEPSREAFQRLNENVKSNKAANIIAFNAAITDAAGFVTFYEPKDHLTNGSIDMQFAGIFDQQPDKTIVLCMGGNQMEELITGPGQILLKIDTEGAESIVLKGLREFIIKHKPCIIIEVLEPYQQSLNEIDFIQELYTFYAVTGNGLVEKERLTADHEFRDYYLKPSVK